MLLGERATSAVGSPFTILPIRSECAAWGRMRFFAVLLPLLICWQSRSGRSASFSDMQAHLSQYYLMLIIVHKCQKAVSRGMGPVTSVRSPSTAKAFPVNVSLFNSVLSPIPYLSLNCINYPKCMYRWNTGSSPHIWVGITCSGQWPFYGQCVLPR